MKLDLTKAAALSRISKMTGQTPLLVQAGGGNTSVKLDEQYMLVKASGCRLTDVTEHSGYSVVDYRRIAECFRGGEPDDAREQEILAGALVQGGRPSIETFLHAVTKPYTIHTHPLGVSIYTARRGGMKQLKELFPEAVLVEYATPGIRLAKKFCRAMLAAPESRVVFLENHGFVISADTEEEAVELQRELIERVDTSLGLDTSAFREGQRVFDALRSIGEGLIAYCADSDAVTKALQSADGPWSHAYSPDCVVYCGSRIAVLKEDYAAELQQHYNSYGTVKVVIAGGHLFSIADTFSAAADIASVLDLTARLYLSGANQLLEPKECDFLLNWDSEKYRIQAGRK